MEELWPDFGHKPVIQAAFSSADVEGHGFVSRREFEKLLRCLVYFNQVMEDPQ